MNSYETNNISISLSFPLLLIHKLSFIVSSKLQDQRKELNMAVATVSKLKRFNASAALFFELVTCQHFQFVPMAMYSEV